MKSLHLLPVLAILALSLNCSFVSGAYAQAQDEDQNNGMFEEPEKKKVYVDELDPKYRGGGSSELSEVEITDAPGILPNFGSTIYFVHKPDTNPNEAVLRIDYPLSLSGCAEVKQPEVVLSNYGTRLQVLVNTPIIKMDKTPQYGHNACKQSVSSAIAEVTLNRDEMIRDKIDKISFRSSMGSDEYDVYVDERKIALYTKYRDPLTMKDKKIEAYGNKFFFKPYNSPIYKKPLTYWFYPENTVLLSVPLAPPNSDFSADIEKFAQNHGMMDLNAFIPGFESPVDDKNTLYFVDQAGTLAAKLQNGGMPIGVVTASETFYGPEGPYEKPKNYEIHAKLPGLME